MTDKVDLKVNGWSCSYARFGPSALTRIAGMPQQIQRLWRQRGLLPGPRIGEPCFSAHDVAETMLRYDLSKLGVPPTDSAAIGQQGANIVLWFALINSGDACEVRGSAEDTERFVLRFEKDETIADLICGNPEAKKFIFRNSRSEVELVAEFSSIADDRAMFGAFLDLEKYAAQLVKGARCPLITVTIGNEMGAEVVRRLTGGQLQHLRLV